MSNKLPLVFLPLNNLYISSQEKLPALVLHITYENKGGILVTFVVVGANCGGITFFLFLFRYLDTSPELYFSGLACDIE